MQVWFQIMFLKMLGLGAWISRDSQFCGGADRQNNLTRKGCRKFTLIFKNFQIRTIECFCWMQLWLKKSASLFRAGISAHIISTRFIADDANFSSTSATQTVIASPQPNPYSWFLPKRRRGSGRNTASGSVFVVQPEIDRTNYYWLRWHQRVTLHLQRRRKN